MCFPGIYANIRKRFEINFTVASFHKAELGFSGLRIKFLT